MKYFIAGVLVFLVFVGILLYFSAERYTFNREKCEQAGGILLQLKHEFVCLKRDAVIEVK